MSDDMANVFRDLPAAPLTLPVDLELDRVRCPFCHAPCKLEGGTRHWLAAHRRLGQDVVCSGTSRPVALEQVRRVRLPEATSVTGAAPRGLASSARDEAVYRAAGVRMARRGIRTTTFSWEAQLSTVSGIWLAMSPDDRRQAIAWVQMGFRGELDREASVIDTPHTCCPRECSCGACVACKACATSEPLIAAEIGQMLSLWEREALAEATAALGERLDLPVGTVMSPELAARLMLLDARHRPASCCGGDSEMRALGRVTQDGQSAVAVLIRKKTEE